VREKEREELRHYLCTWENEGMRKGENGGGGGLKIVKGGQS